MASKKGLGRSLSDMLAESERINEARNLSNLISPETNVVDDLYDEEYVIIPKTRTAEEAAYLPVRPDDPLVNENPQILNRDQLPDEGYPTEYVEQISPDDDPALYGQGPDRSTRVAAHKFVPLYTRLATRAGITNGTVYIKFHKRGPKGQIWKYERVPVTVYSAFTRSNSKGRFINQFLNNYSYGPADGDPNTEGM